MPERVAAFPIDPLFLERWSPRAFLPEALPQEALLTMLEAARWAPSAYNEQPSSRRPLEETAFAGPFPA